MWAIGSINRVFMYVFASWNLDILQNNINNNIPIEVVYTVIIWNYVIGITIACLLWKYIGLPKITVIGKSYKRFMDIYYVD